MRFMLGLYALFSMALISSEVLATPIGTKIFVRNTFNVNYMDENSQCSIDFSLMAKGSLENVKHIHFHTILKNKNDQVVLKQISKSYPFVEVSGKSFSSFSIDDDGACNGFGGIVDITKAIVTYNDGSEPEDIIKTKKLEIDNFEPVKINIESNR